MTNQLHTYILHYVILEFETGRLLTKRENPKVKPNQTELKTPLSVVTSTILCDFGVRNGKVAYQEGKPKGETKPN